jgi:hypothetical protein
MIDSWDNVVRRLVLWTFLCGVSAIPSFYVGSHEFDTRAMLVGVGVFSVAYTLFTSTTGFRRFAERPSVRRTLYIGYGTRIGISVLYPVGMAADLIPGFLSVGIVGGLGIDPKTFAGTLLATLVQGTLLNIILSVYMAVVFVIVRAVGGRRERHQGFEVILPAEPVEPGRGR